MSKLLGYRVRCVNAKENRTLLKFPDLCAKFSSGYVIPLQVWEGDEIPIDVLDPEDVRKSLRVGTLRSYLDSGKIEEIYEIGPEPISIPQSVPSVDQQEPTVPEVAEKPVEQPAPVIPQPIREEEKASDQTPLTDFNLVKTYDDFNRLSYFLKLRFIKESKDITLLKEISARTQSNQFKNNINLRLAK